MKMALWLLALFGIDEAFVGDLIERRTARSRAWFWRQALAAIVLQRVLTWGGLGIASAAAFVCSLVVLSSAVDLLRLWMSGYVALGCAVLLADVASQRGRA